MKLHRFRVQLLMRLYLVIVLMVITFGTGLATGFSLFYRLLYVLVLAAVLGYVWTWLMLKRLEVKVESRSREARVGDVIEETITARNHSVIPKLALEFKDQTDLPGSLGGMGLSLGSKGSSTWSIQTRARRRGTFFMGPMNVRSTDPFGLFARDKQFGTVEHLTVYPRVHPLPNFEVPSAALYGDSATRRRSHHVSPHASSVREYAFGDSLSRIHWNSTAKVGKLMSKEFDLGRASEAWVVVDLDASVQAGDMEESTDEYAVSIGASLAKRYLDGNLPVGMVAFGDERYFLPAETGGAQMDRMLRYLALAKAEGVTAINVALANYESLFRHNSSVLVITSSPDPEWVVAATELSRRGVRLAAVWLDAATFKGEEGSPEVPDRLYASGVPTYIVKKGDEISIALGFANRKDGVHRNGTARRG